MIAEVFGTFEYRIETICKFLLFSMLKLITDCISTFDGINSLNKYSLYKRLLLNVWTFDERILKWRDFIYALCYQANDDSVL